MASRRAVEAYKRFHGDDPRFIDTFDLPDTRQNAYRLGRVEAIAYRAKRYGKWDSYIHEFDRKAGPELDVSDDGSQLYLTGGQYRVTDHGIEDDHMPPLLIANPSPPRSRRCKPKVVYMQRNSKGQFMKRKKATSKPRRSNPAPVRVTRRAAPKLRRSNPTPPVMQTRRSVARYKRRTPNPKSFLGIDPLQLVLSGSSQAVGAVATSIAFSYLPLPAQWKTGAPGALAKIATGVALGALISKMGKGQKNVQMFAQNFAEGTFVLAAVEWIKGVLPTGVPMGLIEYTTPDGQIGYLSASQVVDDVDGITTSDMAGIVVNDMASPTELYPAYGGPEPQYQSF